MIVFMYIRQREPAKIVSKEWKLTIVFLRGLNVVSPDGNGRTGRMVLYRECLRQDIMPFIIHNENRIEYISALNKAQTGGDYADLVTLFEKEQLKYTEMYEYFDVEARYKYYLDNIEEDITIGEVGERVPRM